jgi:formyl-CoA transferase
MPLQTDPHPGALAGIHVLDCGQLIAGGMVGMLLADFGADVIKIEHPVDGDPLRSFGRRRGTSPLYWRFLARNKRSITLALNTPDGQRVFRRLVAATSADIVIESFRPGTMERWGLGQEVLEDIRAGLILVRLSGYGQTGPYRARPGFGTLAEAMSGFAEMTGQADGPPTLPPIALADSVAALYATVGVLVALRARDGAVGVHGQTVDASLLDSLFSLLGNQLIEYDQLGIVARRDGNRAPTSAPRNLYRTADGRWVAIAAPTRNVFERLMRTLARPDLVEDPRFATNEARLANVDAIDEVVAAWVSTRERPAVLRLLVNAEVPVAPVADMAELADDPHLVERGTIASVADQELGVVRMPGVVPRLTASPGTIRRPAPDHGAANEEVYRGILGMSASELAALRGAKII